MVSRVLALAIVAGGLFAAAPRATAAADPPLDLAWTVPAGCPDRDYVVAEVQSLLKGAKSTTPVRATATIAKVPSGLRLTLIATDADGEQSRRELDSADCRALADSAALFLALAINPDAGDTPGPEPSPAPVASSVAPPAASPTPAPSPRPPPPPPAPVVARDLGIAVWTAPLLGVGAAPGPAYGGALGVGARIGPIWSGLSGTVSPVQSYEIAARPGNLVVSTYAVHPHAGVRFGRRRWLELTAGLEIASIGASFDAIASATPSRMLRLSPTAGSALLIPLGGSLYVRLFAAAMLPLARPRYTVTVDGQELELHRTTLVLGQLGLGLEVRP